MGRRALSGAATVPEEKWNRPGRALAAAAAGILIRATPATAGAALIDGYEMPAFTSGLSASREA